MTDMPEKPYEETVSCEGRPEEGVVFIKVVAMPYEDAVEFEVTQARAFAQRILAAVDLVESGWVGSRRHRGIPVVPNDSFKPMPLRGTA